MLERNFPDPKPKCYTTWGKMATEKRLRTLKGQRLPKTCVLLQCLHPSACTCSARLPQAGVPVPPRVPGTGRQLPSHSRLVSSQPLPLGPQKDQRGRGRGRQLLYVECTHCSNEIMRSSKQSSS